MIDVKGVGWTTEETELAVRILRKIAFCQQTKHSLPGEVFEAFCRAKKNISTELGIFDADGRIYLIERPSLHENPSEPYPGQLHLPGVTHNLTETTEDTFDRLRMSEGVRFNDAVLVGEPEPSDGVRGRYLCRVFAAQAHGDQENRHGIFFVVDDIPWDRVVRSHREVIIPLVVAFRAMR